MDRRKTRAVSLGLQIIDDEQIIQDRISLYSEVKIGEVAQTWDNQAV